MRNHLPLLCVVALIPFTVTAQGLGSLGNTLDTSHYPGATLDQKLTAADAALGSQPGTILISAPGAITASVAVRSGHAVVVQAPITIAATVKLGANTSWTCQSSGVLTLSGSPAPVFSQAGVDHVSITGCTVHGPGHYLLSVTGKVSHIALEKNHLDDLGLFNSNSPATTVSDFDAGDNTVTFPTEAKTNASGVYGFYVVGARIHGNSFTRTFNGVQWWGGDAKDYELSTGAAANLTITGNTCSHVLQSCIWGSKGSNITVSGNTSDGNGDVTYDAEGSVSVNFTHNTARHCGNGCGAWFFGAKDITFTGNTFDGSGGNAFLGKNASADPSHATGITVSGNTITCAALCAALRADAVSDLRFDGNTVTNGRFVPVAFAQGALSISRNTWTFSLPLPASTPVILVPSMIKNSTATVEGNVLSSTVPQPPSAVGIAATSADFNTVDSYTLRKNRISGFGVGIATSTSGGNHGVSTNWTLDSNTIAAAKPIAHAAANPNENYRLLNNHDASGGALH